MAVEDGDNPPSATVYVRNLNERTKLPKLINTLRELFEEVGTVVDVIAKGNVKAKGQAFIVFESEEEASDAIDMLQGFEIKGRPMQLAFAKSRSDATVEREDGPEGLEQHKRHRLAEKERKQALEAATAKPTKRPAPDQLAERPAKSAKNAAVTGIADEYLPPNKIIFLREFPDDYGVTELTHIFNRFPGFKEIRIPPVRKGIAFVEYETEEGAIQAKESTAGMSLGDKTLRVTFQRQG